ncbi:hypothetical protein E2C01_068235 [Portunus trituberculatus]|uniref:Uncharacterized protein n=1 Tax=Portunus trituberculatus TaxID=210409 RepID=A0A5B7HV88_PORTR|nr:hypothetical protein [Portunus trituberculatus]
MEEGGKYLEGSPSTPGEAAGTPDNLQGWGIRCSSRGSFWVPLSFLRGLSAGGEEGVRACRDVGRRQGEGGVCLRLLIAWVTFTVVSEGTAPRGVPASTAVPRDASAKNQGLVELNPLALPRPSPQDPHSNEVHGMSVNGAEEVAAVPAWRTKAVPLSRPL